MSRVLSAFRRELAGAVAGAGLALTFSATLRAATNDRAWLVGLQLLGLAVLVLGLCVVFVRRSTPEPTSAEPLELPGSVRDRSRPARQRLYGAKPGPRTPFAEVVRHPAVELPLAQRIEDATTVVVRRDATAVLPAAHKGRH